VRSRIISGVFFWASSVGAGLTANLCHSPFTYINPPCSHPRCDRFIVLVGYPKCELNPPWESAIASLPVIGSQIIFLYDRGGEGAGLETLFPSTATLAVKPAPTMRDRILDVTDLLYW